MTTENSKIHSKKNRNIIRNAGQTMNHSQRIDMNARINCKFLQSTTVYIFDKLHVFLVVECNNKNHFDLDANGFFCRYLAIYSHQMNLVQKKIQLCVHAYNYRPFFNTPAICSCKFNRFFSRYGCCCRWCFFSNDWH